MARLSIFFFVALSLCGLISCLPTCTTSIDGAFSHPGIYHDCSSLNRLQSNIANGNTSFVASLDSAVARTPAMSSSSWTMAGPYSSVNFGGADGHNIPLQLDGKAAYKLVLGWYGTGNTTWLSRAKSTILAWGNTLSYLDEQIQGGEGIAYLTAAAEILRYTATGSGWTTANTDTYNAMIQRILSQPWTETDGLTRNNFFMNQGFYGNNGAMTVAVFSNNATLFSDMINHAAVGANPDPTIDYALPVQISGEEAYYGQVTEMGRDQAHPMGTLRGLSYIGHTSLIQGGSDFYELDSKRLLAGFEYWSRYNSGNNVSWEPKVVRPGSGEVYSVVNDSYRGRNYATYGAEPLEAIGVAYHEFFNRGYADLMPEYVSYMKDQGPGWDIFEFGNPDSVAYLGF